jgi:ribose transport system substrate-binding protein
MGVTIKDVANQAGVSIATVSHVINKTRYVSPELVEKIERVIRESGYVRKVHMSKSGHLRMGKKSEIALVIPNTFSVVYSRLIVVISNEMARAGFLLTTYLSNDDLDRESHLLTEIMSNKRTAGVIIAPVSEDSGAHSKLQLSGIPFVCIERSMSMVQVDSILSDNFQGIYKGTEHLIKCGHENIALLIEDSASTTVIDRVAGYKAAMMEYGINYRDDLVIRMDLENESNELNIIKFLRSKGSTAIFAGGNTLTLLLLKAIKSLGIECPKELSIVGFGDDNWCQLITPPLTTLKQDMEKLGQLTAQRLIKKISEPISSDTEIQLVPMDLAIRKSTQNIARGPLGEMAVYPEDNLLTDDEINEIQSKKFTVAISFHYSGDEWTALHEQAIRETLHKYGIRLLSVADAHFDPALQIAQLEGIMLQHPDAIIAVPTDEEKTAEKFKEISSKTKLILINNMPQGFSKNDYSCWISVNERENGQNAAKILIDHFEGQSNVKIGMLTHGTPFFATKQRDFFAELAIRDQGLNLEIVAKRNFYNIEGAYDACTRMFQEHPEIQGLYITWERPALKAIEALQDLGRPEVVISTTDLDYKIASYMAKGQHVIGLSSQRPYDQGVAVAVATAKALLGKTVHQCIGVPPYTVLAENLEKAWKDLIKKRLPDSLSSFFT